MTVDFRLMRDAGDLPAFLQCDASVVARIVRGSDDDLFDRHHIPKKGHRGGTREVWEVKHTEISDLYRGLNRKLQTFFGMAMPEFPHAAAHGYVPGRSTLTNASAHLDIVRGIKEPKKRQIIKADVREFFRSITTRKVVGFLEGIGMTSAAAEALSTVVCRQDQLPLGLATSPTLANGVCYELDCRLDALTDLGCYTRYGDDLTFSGPRLPSREAVTFELQKDGFEMADEKWRVVSRGRGLCITGLSIEDLYHPRAPKAWKRRLRQDVHFAKKYGLENHISRRGYSSIQSGINVIHGRIQYLRGIEEELGLKLHRQWTETLTASGYSVAFPSVGTRARSEILFVIDESVVPGPDGSVLMLCLTIVEDAQLVRGALTQFLSDRTADPFGGTSQAELHAEGLHWTSLTQDDRTRATERIRALPFRAFIGFGRLDSQDRHTYQAAYERLLGRLLTGRFVRYDGCRIQIMAEENSKVPRSMLPKVVTSAYDLLASRDARRPEGPPSCAVVAKKADAALPLPDLLLGIFSEYARLEITARADVDSPKRRLPGEQAAKRYQQVRDKIRAIYDCDKGLVFSRRKPFCPWQ